jgi:hypothetical protein
LSADGRQGAADWPITFALELGLLFTPYPSVFNIPVTTRFVVVTVAAHAIFGVGLGLAVRALERRARPSSPAPAGAFTA